jgi:O-antigen/teichoic acid export membrane protein
MSGLVWKIGSQLVAQFSRVGLAIILARLLTPADFGVAGMALVLSSLILIFADVGLGAAIVQRADITEEDLSTVFWVSLAVSSAFTVIGIAASPLLASFFHEPALQPLVAVLSISFLLTGLGATQTAVLTKHMNFRALETRQMYATAAAAAAAIATAAAGGGAWAIITQQVAAAGVGTILLWRLSDWRPQFRFSWASLRRHGGFGGNVFGTRVLFYFSRNGDNVLIGRFLGSAALGAYSFAYNLMLIPFDRIAAPLQEVLFPALARIQEDRVRVGQIWLRANRLVASITLPAMLGLAVLAPDFVNVVVGSRWEAAIPVVQILALVGFLQSLVRLNSSILEACDRTSTLLRWSILISTANLAAFAIGLHWGIVGVAAAYAVTNTLLQPVNTYLTGRPIGVSVGTFARNVLPVACAGVGMAVIAVGLRHGLMSADVPAVLRLVLVTVVAGAVYLGLLWWVARDIPAEFRRLIDRRRARSVRRPLDTSAPPLPAAPRA